MTLGIDTLGRRTIRFFTEIGQVSLLQLKIVRSMHRLWRDRRLVLEQMAHIGVGSLPLVLIIGLFTGMVSSWQAAYQFQGMISFSMIGGAVSRAIFIELGPVLTAIVIAGRVGASIAAEIGTMKVTEQIDALESMAIDPVRYLAMPRFLGAVLMMPVLVVFANSIALVGAFLVANFFLDITPQVFFGSVERFFENKDVFSGILKSVFFGGVTAILGCHIGFRTSGGAEGVGLATIRSFVLSSAMILILDYALWLVIF
ncbi:MAG: ABC transporter permease [Bacteroidota bacterium]|jgi:phospholipid/cholesterol/gamma-HCH transport system permease protein|nr:ABC transporter permease [Bacteroidota bacterium]